MNFEALSKPLPAWALGEVTLRLAQPDEITAACAALDRHHYLGAPKRAGCDVVQLAQGGPGHEKNLAHALFAALPPGALDEAIVGGDALYADASLARRQDPSPHRPHGGEPDALARPGADLVVPPRRDRQPALCAPAFVPRNQRRLPAALRELFQPLKPGQ